MIQSKDTCYDTMVIVSSDSCNTLVSLERNPKQFSQENDRKTSPQGFETYTETDIFLPVDELSNDISRSIYLPTNGRVDDYLKHIPEIVEGSDQLLAREPVVFSQSSTQRILYVGQGEVAYALSSQCDVLVSDRATTCHMLALRSESQHRIPLTSMAHIDSATNESCIRSMVAEHLTHHSSSTTPFEFQEEKKDEFDCSDDSRMSLQLHLMGGFEDAEGCSVKISDRILRLFADLAREFKESMKMTLETCAISSLNDNGYNSPIGRGLAIDLRTGDAYLAKVDKALLGPVPELRAVRNWSDEATLGIIHTSRSNSIEIQPFSYTPIPEMQVLINLPDDLLLQCTSTSPDVEQEGFCEAVRVSLRYLLDTPCSKVFCSTSMEPLIFRRSGASNTWRRSST